MKRYDPGVRSLDGIRRRTIERQVGKLTGRQWVKLRKQLNQAIRPSKDIARSPEKC